MKKKIAYIVHSLNLGGTERLAVDMSLAFRDSFQMHIICLDEPGIWAGNVRGMDIPVTCFYRQEGLDLTIPQFLAAYARKNQIDLFHAHQSSPWFYSALSRFFYSKPKLLFQEHGRLYPEILNKKRRFLNKVLIQKLTHKAVAVSEDVKRRLNIYEGLNSENCKVIYNGTKVNESVTGQKREDLRYEFGFQKSDIVVGSVGRLDQIKNFPLMLKGFTKAKKQIKNLKGIIIGDGPMKTDLFRLIKELKIEEDFKLPGYKSNAAVYTNVFDIFTLLSFSEGTSMALLESMACGLPSIVTDVGGNPEIVLNGETGRVIPSDDVSSFSEVLVRMCKKSEKRRELGNKARKRYQEKFTFDHMVKQYELIYGEILN